ncbi:formyltetrahydrofolate deformylase [Arcobacter sp. 15-2]|uniref:formyltetrahydrofolate deformylase n=1 Tax=Arcobacter sp. 15-2 TaxID=3374109 RepID=UPI00399D3655
MNKYRLLIETNDTKGLVYNISKILFEHNLNIDSNSEYVDDETNQFFMRSVISGEFNETILLRELKEILPDNASIKLTNKVKKDIVILATKEMHCLGDLLIKHEAGELDANITAVVSNRESLRNLVEKFNIPFEFISHENLSREEHEVFIIDAIKKYNYELIVLAKYMRILTPNFVQTFPGQVLNIHHSFLPAFIGANPYKQAHSRGVKIIGATSHWVTDDLDEGPIIAQDITRVDHSYSWEDMRDAGRNVEKVVLSKALDLVLKDKVFIYGNKTVIL